MYHVKDVAYTSNRNGPKLDAFPLATMQIGQCFDIPLRKDARGKMTPEKGINIKSANATFFPRQFKKKKIEAEGVVRVFRVKDAPIPTAQPPVLDGSEA